METIQNPYDGEPPDHLLDDFHAQLVEYIKEFEPIMEKGRQLGIAIYVGCCAYDVLTDVCHRERLYAGDRNAILGMMVKDIRDAGSG